MNEDEKQRHYERAEQLLNEQNFPAALIAGAVATPIAALAYAVLLNLISVATGFAAAGAGTLIGLAMVFTGRGISNKFGIAAAIYTIAGCLLGEVIARALLLMRTNKTTTPSLPDGVSVGDFAVESLDRLSLVYVVYLFVAVFAAVFVTKRGLSREDRLALGLYEMRK